VEANAIAPSGARQIAAMLEPLGLRVADGGIVGGPPASDGSTIPLLYLSGPAAQEAAGLVRLGLSVQVIEGDIGAASALKMALAGISKGQTGLVAMMLRMAEAAGVSDPFLAQVRASHPGLAGWSARQFTLLDDKAGRWEEEMAIIAAMAEDVPGASEHFRGLARHFSALAASSGSTGEAASLCQLMEQKAT
jgi:3-hydroxyisobutyrate dehydrogenase-like beta-hydroxyacid dehydrogenase